jgi:predicted house-cleaning noncanonical NTP pyrophosphatase (MazG superfamily)
MSQGKLVRDKIPQIIRSKGLEPVIYTASADEYGTRLRDKLKEEVDEFIASDNDPEELADILEVLYALAEQAGIDRQQMEKLRAAKAQARGGFADRIIWSGNRPAAPASGARTRAACKARSAAVQASGASLSLTMKFAAMMSASASRALTAVLCAGEEGHS